MAASLEPQAVLVLGGTGYIGRHLVFKLIDAGYKPIVTYRSVQSLETLCSFLGQAADNIISVPVSSDTTAHDILEESQGNKIVACINLIGGSVGDGNVLAASNIDSAYQVSEIFSGLKRSYSECVNYHFSSIATLKSGDLSQYSETKLNGEDIIKASGQADYVIYHSIVESNLEKIERDLQKLAPEFCKSDEILDRVELATLTIDYLSDAVVWHLSYANSTIPNKEFVILQHEMTLRIFMQRILGGNSIENSTGEQISLDQIWDAIENANLPDSVRKRFRGFVNLARISDAQEREGKNHYFHFGRLHSIRLDPLLQIVATVPEQMALYRRNDRDFIIPAP